VKEYLIGWIGLALLGGAGGTACLAQTPLPVPPEPSLPAAAVEAQASDQPCGAACDHGCCCCATRKICVPEAAKKKIDKVTYACKCVEFCLPACPGLRGTCKDCQGCEVTCCPACGPVRTKKVLIKKVQTIECDTFKCTPVEVCCPDGCKRSRCP
jgi:hypothetical protein